MKQTYNSVRDKVPYAHPFIAYVEGAGSVESIVSEYENNRRFYKGLQSLKGQLRKAQRGEKGSPFEDSPVSLARPLYVISVASIKTPTDIWERETVKWLDGDITLREYINQCRDSEDKLTCIQRVEDSNLLEKVDGALRGHHTLRAVKLLSGQEHDFRTYLRGAKAWFPVSFMFGVGCMDTNVHTAIRPILQWNLENEPIYHPSMNMNQKGQAMAKAEKWPSGQIPPHHKDWIDRRVSEYNSQDELSGLWEIVETVMKGRVPKDILPQVLFNVGGRENNATWGRTIHAPIYEALGRNLEGFRDD